MRITQVILFLVAASTRVMAQCDDLWMPDPPAPALYGDHIREMITWDPDGAGPDPEVLVATGGFSFGFPANSPASIWNGHQWSLLTPYLQAGVGGVVEFNGDLYFAGDFQGEDGFWSGVIRWDGTGWSQIGNCADGSVGTLLVYNNELVAGGYLRQMNGSEMFGLAAWNGTSWHSLGYPFFEAGPMAAWQGKLIVARNADLHAWDGKQWTLLTTTSFINDLFVHQDELYLGIAGTPGIVRWDGAALVPVGTGINIAQVSAITVFQGEFVIGGHLEFPGQLSLFARLVGDTWAPLPNQLAVWSTITDLEVFGGKLVAAGDFVYNSGGAFSLPAVQWDGYHWASMGDGFDEEVNALAVHQGSLYAGGRFISRDSTPLLGIARKDGDAWLPLGSGISGCCPNVSSILTRGDEIIIAGQFDHAGDVEVNAIARWDGVAWHPMGFGFYGADLLADFRGDVIATGLFDAAGSLNAAVARWTGTLWEPIALNPNTVFSAMQVVDDYLYVANYDVLRRWDGSAWTQIGDFDGGVHAITKFDGKLIVGGEFLHEGATPLHGVAAWNGAAWEQVGVDPPIYVYSIARRNGRLIAGTNYQLAAWDGSTWSVLSDAQGAKNALAVFGRSLMVGGLFPPDSDDTGYASFFAELRPTASLGDADGNGILNLLDLATLESCVSGPRPDDALAGSSAQCLCTFNSDGDADFDLADFAALQRAFTASN